MTARGTAVPLVVDLDGTLMTRDSFVLMAAAATRAPRALARAVRTLPQSRSAAKHELWHGVGLPLERIRFSRTLVALLTWEHEQGRRLVLATGAPTPLAELIADRLAIFDMVLASVPEQNLTSTKKAAALVERFGESGFDYAGNALADVPVWERSRFAIVCNAPRHVRARAASVATVAAELDDRRYRGPVPQSALAALGGVARRRRASGVASSRRAP